ncbi:MAG: CDP-glycerol glycerophosphotransferase family protein [Patescibacteria group bacterium]|mgnify:CR=1 FL=1
MADTHENPQATIGFVIYYPFQFYVYKNVYEHLKEQAEFVIDLGVFFPNRQTEDVLPSIEALLTKHGARYRVLQHEDYYYAAYLERFFSRYDALVSVWWRGCITRPQNALRKKVHITYGAGKELTTFDLRKINFDLVLAYGEYDHNFYSLITKSVVIGNPKFDDWFNDSLNMSGISDIVEKLDPKKKTVLYLPTHSDLSSIDELAASLVKAGEKYNVIAKLHYYTPREEPQRVEKLIHPSIILLKDDADLLPLLKIADIVISDNSSAIFDAVLADKPIVVADFHSPEYLDTAHRERRMYRRGAGGTLTYSGSIEQKIKRDGTVDAIASPHELLPTIERAITHDDKAAKRKELARRLFAHQDGHAGRRGAESIRKLLKEPLGERPFLYHAVQHYTVNALGRPKRSPAWVGEYLLARENFKESILQGEKGMVFSVIMLPRNASYRPQALRSISEQDFPKEKYELIELPEGETLEGRVARAIAESKGAIICFATDDCVLPASWLTALSVAYERNPQIGGAGGYVRAAKENYTLFDEYNYRELARKLNVPLRPGFLSQLYEVTNQLPGQNPTGTLSAMSYRREELSRLPHLSTIIHLEQYIKNAVIANSPLCFIPLSVTRLSPLSRGDFMLAERDRGYMAAFKSGRGSGFWGTLADAVGSLVHGYAALARVMLLAGMARGFGAAQAHVARLMGDVSSPLTRRSVS